MGIGTKIAFRCTHQLCRTYAEGSGDFQYQCERGHVLPTLDLAHMRASYTSHGREFILSDSLRQAGSTHRLAEGQCRLGFIGGCARGAAPVERCASASPEASINRPNLTTLKISLLAIMVARLFDPIALWGLSCTTPPASFPFPISGLP